MLTSQYDIIVETLTGSEFEMTVSDKDTIGYIKSRIQKYEGIPIGQQHLLYNHKELSDTTEMKDIPLVNGSRLKLVLDMKGGPVSARRVVNLPDYDNWFDLNDVLNTSSRNDPLTISTPSVKLLLYKDYKKNVHRIMKLRSDRKAQNAAKASNENTTFTSDNKDQWVKDNLKTIGKMHHLRMQLEQKKKNKNNKKQKNNNIDAQQTFSQQIDVLAEDFKKQTLSTEPQIINKKTPSQLNPVDHLHHQQRKNSFHEFPISTLPRRSLSSGLLNKFGLNKTCIRPPSFIAQQRQQHQSHHQNQQRRSESNFFQLHALSPLSLPSPGLTLSSSSLSKFSDIKSQPMAPAISESNVKDNFQILSLAAAAAAAASFTTSTNLESKQQTASLAILSEDSKNSNSDFDLKAKLRENIRRNRSFKSINGTAASHESLVQCPPLLLNSPLNNRSLSSMIDQIFGANISSSRVFEKSNTSKSVQDLIEKIAITGVNASSICNNDINPNNFSNLQGTEVVDDEVGIEEASIRLLKPSTETATTSACTEGFENKLFLDRHHQHKSLGLSSIDTTSDSSGCAGDFQLEATASSPAGTSALDSGSSICLYKMTPADATNNYELPKLLIREDSPVESFHSLDPQFETLTIRGDTSKSRVDTFSKLATATNTPVDSTTAGVTASKTIIKTPWNHHHSDLGLNNLELNFLNDEYSDLDAKLNPPENCAISSESVLKMASNLEISNCWNSNSSELSDGRSQPSTNSLNFINGDLTSSDDEEEDEEEERNLFNNNAGGSCCMLHSNSKSKSIELNDFRMMFGSSPTLLNSTNYNSVTHTSRLDAVPIQYRRGYTNLNDACLSSSTSDLELFNSNGVSSGGVRKKNSSKSASQELPSAFSSARHHSASHHLLHHHHHQHHKTVNSSNSLDFVRSYENLDRTKILRMKNEQIHQQNYPQQQQSQHQQLYISSNRNSSLLGKSNIKHFWDGNERFGGNSNRLQKNFSHEKLQEEDFYIDDEDFTSYANLGYENALITATTATTSCGGGDGGEISGNRNSSNIDSNGRTVSNDCRLPLSTGFPSDESLFNMNLDRFTDEFNLLSTMSLTGIGNNNDGAIIGNCNNNLVNDISNVSPYALDQRNCDQNYDEEEEEEEEIDEINDAAASLMLSSDFDIDGKSTIKKVPSSLRKNGLQSLLMRRKNSIETDILNRAVNSAVQKSLSSEMNCKESIEQKPQKKQRCAECNKKLGLIMIMKCHCEKVFCPQHRYAEAHNCSYNFKEEGKKILARENPLVVAQKINKI